MEQLIYFVKKESTWWRNSYVIGHTRIHVCTYINMYWFKGQTRAKATIESTAERRERGRWSPRGAELRLAFIYARLKYSLKICFTYFFESTFPGTLDTVVRLALSSIAAPYNYFLLKCSNSSFPSSAIAIPPLDLNGTSQTLHRWTNGCRTSEIIAYHGH